MMLAVMLVGAVSSVPTPQHKSADLEGLPWIFVQIDGETVVTDSRRPELRFDVEKGEISGHSGVNGFGGNLQIDDNGSMKVTEVVSTLMAGSDQAMKVERAVFNVMSKADGWRRTADYLELTLDGKRVAKLYRKKA